MDCEKNFFYDHSKEKYVFYTPETLPLLSPTSIDIFLSRMMNEATQEKIQNNVTGAYVHYLMQQSYDADNNDFFLHIKDTNIPFLGYRLTGTAERPLRLTIDGNAGDGLLRSARHVVLVVNGNVGRDCGNWASYATISINGNAREHCAENARKVDLIINGGTRRGCAGYIEQSKIILNGDVDDWCAAYAESSELTINGTIGEYCGTYAQDGIFKTQQQNTYLQLQQLLNTEPHHLRNNTIHLIDGTGNVLERVEPIRNNVM